MFSGNFIDDSDPNTIDLSGGGLYSRISLDPMKRNYFTSNFQDYMQNGILSSGNNVLNFNTTNNSSYVDMTQYKGLMINSLIFKTPTEIFEVAIKDIYDINTLVQMEISKASNALLSQMQALFNGLSTKITSLETDVRQLQVDVNQIKVDLLSLTNDITNNSQNIDKIFGSSGYQQGVDLTTLNTKVSTNTANITSNTQKINTNTANINSNTASITSNTQKINTNIASITSNTQKINSNTATITSNTQKISTNTSNITSVTNNYTSLSQRVANINTSLARVQQDINTIFGSSGYQQGVDLTTLNTKVGTNTSNISSNTQKINTNTQKISVNTQDITNLKSSSGNSTEIQTIKQDISSLNTKINNITTNLTSSMQRITTNENNISNNVRAIALINTTIPSNLSTTISSLQSTTTDHTNTLSRHTTLIGNLQVICNALKTLPVVNMSSSNVLDGNGFARFDCSTLTGYSTAHNDNVLGIVPYDIRASTSNAEYATISTQWADFTNDSTINVRLAPSDGRLSVANKSFKVVYLASNPAKNMPI